ncbi:MAG TPA: Gfo/Idh/MocA family oxidoreductase [Puia sp.]|nr:Gfo/Idh/MocA family oxidoreductase [Puia sp.]
MQKKRRDFLKFSALTGFGLGSGILKGFASGQANSDSDRTNPEQLARHYEQSRGQHFNMSGYAAPKLETVRIGFIGLGNRGPAHLDQVSKLEGIDIKALCDLRPEKVSAAAKKIEHLPFKPAIYTGNQDEWKKLCQREDIDLVYIATSWDLHTPMAVYAMNQGKHVCVEVPAAKTLEECWQLVETSERTRKHCMMMENSCYGFFQLLMLNMAREGFFGEIIHAEGAYIHDLLAGNFAKDKYYDLWRLKENIGRNGNLYPTHGLGPMAQAMNINRGEKMEFLVSVSGNDFLMGDLAKTLAATDDFYKPFVDKPFRGNMNVTTIRTNSGRTIMLQHDVSSPRPHVDNYMISGTKATALHYPLPGRFFIAPNFLPLTPGIWKTSSDHEWMTDEEFKVLQEKYTPTIVKKLGQVAKEVGYHGGGDFLMDWRTIDCLRNGLPLDEDVYDAALWSSIAPLTEWSVKNRSHSIDVPDFTRGSWKTNQPLDVKLEKGGTTKVKV